ncbi:hypothetical protein LY76DRAFT_61919 [Colletotrichum caudatum]|nr:hypothetical protein LY76DRAFT_61919 [Colletotrichum caudatum]
MGGLREGKRKTFCDSSYVHLPVWHVCPRLTRIIVVGVKSGQGGREEERGGGIFSRKTCLHRCYFFFSFLFFNLFCVARDAAKNLKSSKPGPLLSSLPESIQHASGLIYADTQLSTMSTQPFVLPQEFPSIVVCVCVCPWFRSTESWRLAKGKKQGER